MNSLDADDVARKAMLSGTALAPEPAPTLAPPTLLSGKTSPALTLSTLNIVMQHMVFRLAFVFLVSFVMLVAINPPFVQARSSKKRNALEAAPCSYGRVMVASAIIAALVALVPLGLKHRERIGSALLSAQSWIKSKAG